MNARRASPMPPQHAPCTAGCPPTVPRYSQTPAQPVGCLPAAASAPPRCRRTATPAPPAPAPRCRCGRRPHTRTAPVASRRRPRWATPLPPRQLAATHCGRWLHAASRRTSPPWPRRPPPWPRKVGAEQPRGRCEARQVGHPGGAARCKRRFAGTAAGAVGRQQCQLRAPPQRRQRPARRRCRQQRLQQRRAVAGRRQPRTSPVVHAARQTLPPASHTARLCVSPRPRAAPRVPLSPRRRWRLPPATCAQLASPPPAPTTCRACDWAPPCSPATEHAR